MVMQMKKIFYFIFILSSFNIGSAVTIDDDFFTVSHVHEPFSDSRIVMTGVFSNKENMHVCYIDLENDTVYISKLLGLGKNIQTYTLDHKTDLNKSNEIAFLLRDSVYIYDIVSGKLINSFLTTNEKIFFNYLSFTNNGNEILLYNIDSNLIAYYDVLTGDNVKNVKINSDSTDMQFISFLKQKELIALKQSLDKISYFSLIDGKWVKDINFSRKANKPSFIDSDNKIMFTENGNFIIIDANTGDTLLVKEIYITKPDRISISSNLKYICVNSYVFDLEDEDFLYTYDLDNFLEKPPLAYVNSTFDKALTHAIRTGNCGTNIYQGQTILTRFIYNLEKNRPIRSVVNKALLDPIKSIISDNNLFFVNVSKVNEMYYNTLVDMNGSLLKYIVLDKKPIFFVDNSTYLVCTDSNSLFFYNVLTDNIDRQIYLGPEVIKDFYYTSENGGKILVKGINSLRIFDYTTLELERTIDLISGLDIYTFKTDHLKHINYFVSPSKLINYNILDGKASVHEIQDIPIEFRYQDISPNGQYVIYADKTNNLGIYNSKTHSFSTKKLYNNIEENLISDIRLIENNQTVLYRKKDVSKSLLFQYTYDFTADKIDSVGDNETLFNISSDKSVLIKYSSLCHTSYDIDIIQNSQSSVETTTEITGTVYPNPASDFIKIDMNVSAMNSSIEIFDAYGKQVKSAIYTGEEIDISSLTAGVYFVKTPSHSYKFIKL